MFKVEFIGNLGADAEVKSANGSSFVSMRAAHTNKYTTASGEEKQETIWADITLSNAESKVVPYLKAGTKVFVRGNGSLRVYSSPKQRMMMAGIQIAATEIELVGGHSEAVPRQLIVPEDGTLIDVQKYYQAQLDTSKMKKDESRELLDARGGQYVMVKGGWVAPKVEQPEEQKQP